MDDSAQRHFFELYEAHADAIYRHCYFRVFSKERAEEFVQETFMKAWGYVVRGEKVDNMKALLYRIATNLVIDHSRKKKEESLEVLLERDASAEPSHGGREHTETALLAKDAVAKIAELREEEREVLLLRYVNDLNPKEIGEALGITPNNASVRLNRAIESLRKKMSA